MGFQSRWVVGKTISAVQTETRKNYAGGQEQDIQWIEFTDGSRMAFSGSCDVVGEDAVVPIYVPSYVIRRA